MARNRPQTFAAWMLGVIGAVLTAVLMYYAQVYAIQRIGQGQIERSEAALQRLRDQQAARLSAQQVAIQAEAQKKAEQATYDAQVAQAMAESQRRHDEAWSSYYQPKKGCDAWQSDAHMVECVNHKMRAKEEFERKWAAGEIGTPQG